MGVTFDRAPQLHPQSPYFTTLHLTKAAHWPVCMEAKMEKILKAIDRQIEENINTPNAVLYTCTVLEEVMEMPRPLSTINC